MSAIHVPRSKSGWTEQPRSESHLMARGRAILLSPILVGVDIVGSSFLWKVVECSADYLKFAVTLAAFVTVLVGTPHIAFLCLDWFTRYREFQNSLKGMALSAYLQRYRSQRLVQGLVDPGAIRDLDFCRRTRARTRFE